MTNEKCDLVIKHEGILGGMRETLDHIKKKVDNGLSEEMRSLSKALSQVQVDCTAKCALKEIAEEKNWFLKILQSSATKVVSFGVVFAFITALTTTGVWMAAKVYAWKELPGQQQSIATTSKAIANLGMESNLHYYHQHILKDGRILMHTGDPNVKAYIFDEKKGAVIRAPYMRTEESIK